MQHFLGYKKRVENNLLHKDGSMADIVDIMATCILANPE